MGRFDFVSPGAEFTGSITRLLMERKAEERQKLMDSLSVNADQRAQAQLTESKRMNDANLAQYNEQTKLDELKAIAGNFDLDSDPDAMGLTPEQIALGKRRGMWKSFTEPSTSTNISGMTNEAGDPLSDFAQSEFNAANPAAPPKTRLGYVGSEKQRDIARRKESSGRLISSLLNDPDEEVRASGMYLLQLSAAQDGDISSGMSQLAPKVKIKIFDMQSGTLKDTGLKERPDTQILTQSRPPRDYQPRNPVRLGRNADGDEVWWDPHTKEETIHKGITRSSNDPNMAALNVPVGLTTALSLAARGLEADSNGIVPGADLRGYRLAAAAIIGRAETTQKVKTLATVYMQNPNTFRQSLTTSEMTEREISDLEQLKNMITTPDIEEILETNAPVKKAPAGGKKIQGMLNSQPWGNQ